MTTVPLIASLPDGFYGELVRRFGVLSDARALVSALSEFGIVSADADLIEYRDLRPWIQSGGETYSTTSRIVTSEGAIHFIAKCLIGASLPIDVQLDNWVDRRRSLLEAGVNVPRLFSASEGMIVEEFISAPLEITEGLADNLVGQLGHIAATLDSLGFRPIMWAHDLRTDGERVYFVDFGNDLGEASNQPSSMARGELARVLSQHQFEIAESGYSKSKLNRS